MTASLSRRVWRLTDRNEHRRTPCSRASAVARAPSIRSSEAASAALTCISTAASGKANFLHLAILVKLCTSVQLLERPRKRIAFTSKLKAEKQQWPALGMLGGGGPAPSIAGRANKRRGHQDAECHGCGGHSQHRQELTRACWTRQGKLCKAWLGDHSQCRLVDLGPGRKLMPGCAADAC